MTKDEALALALEALEESKTNNDTMEFHDRKNKAITAIKQARSAPVQDSTCRETLRAQGKAYPRTCRKCGKGPCIGLANAALDKMAENARELGLEYEPVREDWGPGPHEVHSLPSQPAPVQTDWEAIAADQAMTIALLKSEAAAQPATEKSSATQPVQEPVSNASAWFALVMNAAAELEDASHCLRDEDAKRVAISGAKHYRDAAKALYTTPPAQEFVCSTGLCHYRKPLTNEQVGKAARDAHIAFCLNKHQTYEHALTRAVEAAHGITGETK